jgi:hypothetical protein
MTGLNCSEFVELVTSHLEGKLDRDTERRFTEHLAECEGCDRYLGQFRLTIRMLGELPAESPPPMTRATACFQRSATGGGSDRPPRAPRTLWIGALIPASTEAALAWLCICCRPLRRGCTRPIPWPRTLCQDPLRTGDGPSAGCWAHAYPATVSTVTLLTRAAAGSRMRAA